MAKILCIPDIHCRKFWRQCIDDNIEKVEKVIFLGDYLDPYPNEIKAHPELMEVENPYDAYNALEMLNHIISLKKNEPDKYILLTGNHTDSYIWSKFSAASRTDHKNWEKYHKFFSQNLNFFNLVWVENDCIFSHAGISEGWKNEVVKRLELPEDDYSISVKDLANLLMDTPLTEFDNKYVKVISDISHYRWGDMFYGSCEWADIREHIDHHMTEVKEELVPLGEKYQIFGHTQLEKQLITDKWACLDCRKGFIVDTITYEITKC